MSEFACLLKQLNINLTEKEILRVFDESNTDRTPKSDDGQQVIDEHEFIEFYHSLLERNDEVDRLFAEYSRSGEGMVMGTEELQKFLRNEQKMSDVTLENCEDVVQARKREFIAGGVKQLD